MQRDRSWRSAVVGLGIVVVLVVHLGAGPFVDAVRHVDARSVAVGASIAVVTTVCGAWRWVLVARGLGTELTLRSAVAESYRSQFLNVTLPGGVLGDVHRGVRHGRSGGDVGRGLRSVVWERAAGQVVLGVLTVAAVLLVPAQPGRVPAAALAPAAAVPAAVLAVVVALTALALLARRRARAGRAGRGARAATVVTVVTATVNDIRAGLLGRRTWPGVVVSSTVVVAGHTATFVVAARAAGVTAPVTQLLPLALLVLVAMGLPLNLAGWGPREGAAAWAFGAAGLGAAAGVGTAVVYGVIAVASSLPGAVLLVWARRDRSSRHPSVDRPLDRITGSAVPAQGAARA